MTELGTIDGALPGRQPETEPKHIMQAARQDCPVGSLKLLLAPHVLQNVCQSTLWSPLQDNKELQDNACGAAAHTESSCVFRSAWVDSHR